jgi:hypothetical protein
MDSVAGMTNAPPMPITARAAIRVVASPARAAATDPAAKTPRPSSSARRRPYRSPSAPATMSRAANVSVYASVIHCRSVVDARSSRASVGSAVFRIVLSMTTISSDRHRTARICRRRGCPSVWLIAMAVLRNRLTHVCLQP